MNYSNFQGCMRSKDEEKEERRQPRWLLTCWDDGARKGRDVLGQRRKGAETQTSPVAGVLYAPIVEALWAAPPATFQLLFNFPRTFLGGSLYEGML